MIKSIRIKRFRSIMDLTLNINSNNINTICGKNNVGKTNVLRAINLFFNPEIYVASVDSPHHKYVGSRGQAVCPEIWVDFYCEDCEYISIRRVFDIHGNYALWGQKKSKVLGKG